MTRIYRFGDFRLVPATRELWRGDSPVAVPPRAFDCIVYLVEHRERAVGRDELIAAVWGRTETGDGTLGQTVLAARRALEDTGKEQHVIRTVFRFGYHWVAAVAVTEEMPLEGLEGAAATSARSAAEESTSDRVDSHDSTDAQTALLANEPARNRNVRRLVFAALSLLVLCALVFAVLRWHERSGPSSAANTATQSRNAIALVLPVTVTADTGHDWVRLGLMDLIGGRLRAAGLPVVPSDNVVALTSSASGGADGAIDIAALTRATGANLVIAANAEMIGGRWRVTLRSVHGREPPLLAVGEASDVLAAARTASEHLAQQLGYAPVPAAAVAETDPLALANLSQQIEAAMLSDRLDAARALIASATPAQREQPEIRLRLAQIDYQAGDFDSAEAGFNAVAKSASVEQDAVRARARAEQSRRHRGGAREQSSGDATFRRGDRTAAPRTCRRRARQGAHGPRQHHRRRTTITTRRCATCPKRASRSKASATCWRWPCSIPISPRSTRGASTTQKPSRCSSARPDVSPRSACTRPN